MRPHRPQCACGAIAGGLVAERGGRALHIECAFDAAEARAEALRALLAGLLVYVRGVAVIEDKITAGLDADHLFYATYEGPAASERPGPGQIPKEDLTP